MTQLLTKPERIDAAPSPPPSEEEKSQALQRLVLFVTAGLLLAVLTGTWRTVLVVVALVLMVMLHEWGHYLTARWSGMKVTEFFFGFGPRLWSIRKDETEYGIKAIPAGGYVRIIGMNNLEEVDPEDEPRTYRQKGFWPRLSVGVAGSTMHFLLAFLLFWLLLAFVGQPKRDTGVTVVHGISRFESGPSPAQQAGIKVGDRLISIDGRRVGGGEDDSAIRGYIQQHPNEPLLVVVERNGRRIPLTVVPADLSKVKVEVEKGERQPAADRPTGFIGISFGDRVDLKTVNPLLALPRAVGEVGSVTKLSGQGLADLVSFNGIRSYREQITGSGPVTPDEDTPRLLSPVGFVNLASSAADSGWYSVLYLLAAINVFVGMFNMVPLPPFDGGHVAVAVYEAIRSRRGKRYMVDMNKLLPVAYAVVLLLVFLGATALYLDIARPLKLQ